RYRRSLTRRGLPEVPRRQESRLQLLRLPPRQRPHHDPRHIRQRPRQKQTRHRKRQNQRRRLDPRHVEGRQQQNLLHLRPRHELQERRHAPHRPRRQGLRHGLQPRLGRQGHPPPRLPRRHLRIFRTHPSFQPRRHGRPPPLLQRRPVRRLP